MAWSFAFLKSVEFGLGPARTDVFYIRKMYLKRSMYNLNLGLILEFIYEDPILG